MKYVIDDYDLIVYFEEVALAGLLLGDHRFYPVDFLKDKEQVQLVASGKVTRLDWYKCDGKGYQIGDKDVSDIISEYSGKNIEVYIKVK